MKTITEFSAPILKLAAQKKQELSSAGKTPEELPAALAEALKETTKVEGEKATWLLNAIELVGTRVVDLKRVVVLKLNEGEKAPTSGKTVGEHHFVSEYYPSLEKKPAFQSRDGGERGRGGRDGKRGRGGKGGRDDKRGRGDRRPREEAPRDDSTPKLTSSFIIINPEKSGSQTPTAPSENKRSPRNRRPRRNPAPKGPRSPELEQLRAEAKAKANPTGKEEGDTETKAPAGPLPLIKPRVITETSEAPVVASSPAPEATSTEESAKT